MRSARARRPSADELANAEIDVARFPIVDDARGFERYLRQAGLSRTELVELLAVRSTEVDLEPAPWSDLLATVLQSAFLERCDRDIVGAESLAKMLYPLLGWCALQIDVWEAQFEAMWDTLRPALVRNVATTLFAAAYKALVLEAHLAKLRDEAADAAGRFGSVRRFYLRYAALSRLLATMVLQWRDNTHELLVRLAHDRSQIEATILLASPGAVCRIESADSDPHDGGKRVQIVHFAGGAKIVYKPRPMDVDAGFVDLVGWLNRFAVVPPLRTIRLVVGDGYGWAEFIEADALPDESAAHAFYERQGAYVALLHVTKSTDFHSENVIASGADPMLVDLETLAHADPLLPDANWSRSCGSERLSESVLACGLLPGWASVDMFGQTPDLSGIGAREGQVYRDPSEFVDYDDDGNVRIVRRTALVPQRPNRPSYAGSAINPAAYAADVERGFDRVYRVVQEHAAELLAADGPLGALFQARTRNVTLATIAYAGLISRATHPDFATRSVHRELILADIARRSNALPSAEVLLDAELAALFRGDVPKFSSTPRSTSLFDADGRIVTGFLREPSAAAVERRVRALSPSDHAVQREIVHLAMATLRRIGEPGTELAPSVPIPTEPADPAEIGDVVQRIARDLCAQAIVRDGRIDWIGLIQGDEERSRISEIGVGLYGGVVGIGVFLAVVSARFGDAASREAAELCAARGLDALRRRHGIAGGGYAGRYSIAYGLLHIATALQRTDILDEVLQLLPGVATDAYPDALYDIVAGSAGAIGVLLAAHSIRPDDALLAAAIAAGEHLIETRISCAVGCGWSPRGASAPLTGFSHGAGGIGWALLRLGARTGRDDVLACGRDALAYERSLYSPETKSWPDLRDFVLADVGRVGSALAWCHGPPGIGLARATLPATTVSADDEDDLAVALEAVLALGLAPTDCLCHGELGNIELVVSVGQRWNRGELVHAARTRATGALRRAQQRGRWRCGAIPDEPVPGLLCGMAGIGYGLLRAYAPAEVDSVLALAPPTRRSAARRWSRVAPGDGPRSTAAAAASAPSRSGQPGAAIGG